ncbi:MAG: hypothetical protein BWY68_00178 [bacterium ADurb.Bin400]|nr:MAG: hypothetical protein BWY68_00178 [bacterium ADurb.Bin400]
MLSVDEDLADDFIDTDLEKEEVQAVSQEEIKMRISPKGWERFRLPWFESIYAIIGNLGLSILASLVSLLYFAFKSEEDIERKLPGQNDCEVDAWYEFERFYYQQQNFSFIDALMVTAKEVARWSNGFDAVIADPVSGTEMMRKRGELPKNESERQEYAEKLVWWITNKARFANVFQLTFYNTFPETHHEVTPMFGYCAKTGNWDLYLTEDRFLRLKNAWQKSGLPEDLFYPRIKRVTPRVSGFKLFLSRVFPLVDQQPYLTPREAKASDVMRKGE